ncbi:MAG TPA: hypothetical protein VFX03_03715 [Thermomicrobiales bacterium]|nr:hypothetical protein [Thermomicrobiales bacterium]
MSPSPLADAIRRRIREAWEWFLSPTSVDCGADGEILVDEHGIERPWLHNWDHLPKRSAGAGLRTEDVRTARARAEEVARLTVGDDVWWVVQRQGHVDLPSRRYPGLTYRLRIGQRIEVICAPGASSPWPFPYLCVNPTYPLPEAEFFAHLYLYLRDDEAQVIRVAAPQPWDQALGRTF